MLKATVVLILLLNVIHIKAVYAIENMHHVHGIAELTIAIADNLVNVNFIAPADSLLGFEHQATSSEEITQVTETKKLFFQYKNLLSFHKKLCELKKIEVDTGNTLPTHSHTHILTYSHTHILTYSSFKQ